MFHSVGRRLALLNAAVVVLVIALVGSGTYLLLRESLERESARTLADRVSAARVTWDPLFRGEVGSAITPTPSGEHDDDDDDHHDDEILESGDTLLFALSADGTLIARTREIQIAGLPAQEGVARALAGEVDTRRMILDGEPVRVRTEPVRLGGKVAGAIQAARGDRQQQAELRLVGWASLAGVGLGILFAVPAGLFLARRAMRPIDAAFARQRAFVADASHELRTPLTLIRANAELVQRMRAPRPNEIHAEMDRVLTEVDEMSHLVDDLLLLARADDAAFILERQTVDLAALAREVTGALDGRARDAGLTLTVEARDAVRAVVDEARLRQVLRILLDNAIAYTPRAGRVTVSVERHGDRATIQVRDTGIGIAAEDLPHVFERFYRADRARTRAKGGAGLGLPIARALIHAHGGDIHLDSAPGAGTTVTFWVPAASGA